MADIQYLNYGDLQIELLALLNNLANQVNGYVLKQPWSNKRKEKFMAAYTDLMNRGISGASNSTGQWMLDVGGDPIPFDTMDRKDKEMYQEAAYFIQQQMASLPTKASLEDEVKKKAEEEKTELPIFEFNESFKKHVNTSINGGNPLTIGYGDSDLWNYLDERDPKTGIRGRKNRAEKLAWLLESYKEKISEDGSKFNFEGSPYTDINDFNNKVDAAIKALRTPEIEDDRGALQAIGLNQADWFNNGSGDPSGKKITLEDGTERELTYGQLAEYNTKLEELKQQELLAKQKAALQTAYNNTLFFNRVTNSKMLGQNAIALKEKYKGDLNALINTLNTYALLDIRTLTPDLISEVHGAYKYLAKTPIDNKLLKQLQSSSSGLYKNATPNRFRKIKGIDNLIWDSVAGQVIQINTRQQQLLNILNQPLDLFAGVKTKEEIENTPISKEGWTSADTADVVSMIGDLVSLGGFWANVGGTAVSLTSDIYSDYTRGKGLGDILKGVGVNLGWGLAGLLPGAKSTKVAARAARLVPKAFMLAQSAGIILDPEILKSALKFTKPEEYKNISSKDLENLKYLFHAVTGGTNITKSHYRAKQYRETINKLAVKTADGKTVKLSNKEVAEINKAGRKGGQKAALDKFKEYAKSESAEGLFKFSENGKSKFNPTRYSSALHKFTFNDLLLKGEKVTDLRALSNILKEDANKSWYNWNKGYAKYELTPFRHSSNYKKPEEKFTEPKSLTSKLPESEHRNIVKPERELLFDRATINRYKEHLNGKFSNRKILEGTFEVGDLEMSISSSKDNRKGKNNGRLLYDIHFNGKHFYNLTQDKAKKLIFDLIRTSRRLVDSSGKVNKKSILEMGKILLELKKKGWLKQGGTIDKQKIQLYKEFINK